MGLKDDLIKAEIESLKLTGVSTDSLNTSNGSPLDVKCELTKEAIIKLLESAEFRVTKFVAPGPEVAKQTPTRPVERE